MVQITLSAQCVYKKTTSDFVTLFSDSRIPKPANDTFVYLMTAAGNFAVSQGKIQVGGMVNAPASEGINICYISA